ncbi:FAD-dependent oxidoreductase [Thiomicrorhabdus sp. Kp2]|uniref:FAD-dependent oxidoreductase n=1 Tax=Thiomicrorhabdus sp. Kp2 TaxID=1123518 RepID=UPI0004164546|nr:FAD-dependent oxidoreductase [Thiomicrorhabdus sp. Kp2]
MVPKSSKRPKVAVLGAGLIGRMLTLSLVDEYEVSLFDKDKGDAKQSAAFLAAAMLAPLAESADCDIEIMQMGEQALTLWPEFINKLDASVFFQQAGSLIVAFDQDSAALQQFQNRLKGTGFESLSANQIQALEPELNSRFHKGLYLPNEAQLDNRQLLEAMAQTIYRHDVAWHKNVHVNIVNEDVFVNQKPLVGFDFIIDCRGMGLKEDLPQKQAQFRGVRGEVVRVYAPDVRLHRPIRLMHPRYPIYIAPKENHQFVIGATQLESEDERRPTVRSALELLSACFSVHSGFAEAEILSIDSGLRPAFMDNHPKIYQTKNRFVINGLFRHGYLLAPVIVEECIKQIKKSQQKTEPFDNDKVLTFLPGLVTQENPYLNFD